MLKKENCSTTTKVILVFVALAISSAIHAATYTWDTAMGDSAITDGAGTWQVGIGNWRNVTTYDQAWADANAAVFGGGASGTGGTVTLGGNVAPTSLTVNAPFSGNYVIDTGAYTLTLGGGWDTLVAGANTQTTIQSTGGGSLTAVGSGLFISPGNGANLIISALITGSTQITKVNSGILTLSNTNNSFTGELYMQNGGKVTLASIRNIGIPSAAGAGNRIKLYHYGVMEYTGTGDTSDRLLELGGGGNETIYSSGSGALVLKGAFNNLKDAASILTLRGSNTSTNELQKTLTNSVNGALSLTKEDAGTWVLSTNNNHSGVTTVNGGILKIKHNLALGNTNGNTVVAAGAKLEIDGSAGDLTIPEPITLNYTSGSIRNLAGNNTLSGLITLSNNTDFRRNAGTLTLSGGMTSVNKSISLNGVHIVKDKPITLGSAEMVVTSGSTDFNVAGHDWNLMRLNFGGTAKLGVDNALPTDAGIDFGWDAPGQHSGTLNLNGHNQTVSYIATIASALGEVPAGGAQIITGGGTLAVSQASGTNEYQGVITDGVTSTALIKSGAGKLVLSGTNTFTGATSVQGGVLSFTHTKALSTNMNVYVTSGAKVDLGPGIFIIRNLYVDGVQQRKAFLNATNLSAVLSGTGSFFPTEGWSGTLIQFQ
jgi:fibronectin-binding autotransporter adhesin